MTFTIFACEMGSARWNASVGIWKGAHPDDGIVGEVPKVCELPTDGGKLLP